MLTQFYKKTKRGRFFKVVNEVYLRSDISCGVENCSLCEQSSNIISFDEGKQKVIYILDETTMIDHFDVIENCPILINVVIMQTITESIKKKKPTLYNNLKNMVDAEIYRKMFVFANEFCKDTYTKLQSNETQNERNERAIFNAALWYTKHLQTMDIKVIFICNKFQTAQVCLQQGLNTISIFDFVSQYCQDYPTLVDYLGFQEGMEEENNQESIYESHLNQNEIISLIKQGELFQGKLNVDRQDSLIARAIIPKYKNLEIKIKGRINMNRAFQGDIVAIQILPEDQWEIIQSSLVDDFEEVINEENIIQTQESQKMKNILDKVSNSGVMPMGKVVGIIKRHQRQYCGNIVVDESEIEVESDQPQIREFVCADERYPRFYIKTNNFKALQGKRIVIGFDRWVENSIYPYGHFQKIIGNIGDLETEGKLILLEHNVEISSFSKQVLDCLPPQDDKWQIPEEEILLRMDLRKICVCSVDPPGCKDIDDALHCLELPNGNLEIGVHIADVTYFVRPDTAIDKEAANRCTTVYLVDRRTDMLPKLLTETLCSLVSGVDRLSFSCIWEMQRDGTIVSVKYGKSVIRSQRSLTYEQAQTIINDSKDESQIAVSLRNLLSIAKILKQKRIDDGALTLASTQVKFSFDDETHNPTDVGFYKLFDTNSMIEEFMLLANVAVSQKIIQHFPANSVLRKHSSPKPKQIKEFAKLLQTLGYEFDYSTSKALADSLDQIKSHKDPFLNQLVRILTTRTMNEAQYFNTANADYPEFMHYGLACPLYTHFTSPIRRYADVLVHRLLAAAIDLESLPKNIANKENLSKVCEKMNYRNRMARNASRASSDYQTYLFFKGKNLNEEALITGINSQGYNVIIPQYGLEGNIQFSDQDKKLNELKLKSLENEFQTQLYINNQLYSIFERIVVNITVEMKSFHKQIKLKYVKSL